MGSVPGLPRELSAALAAAVADVPRDQLAAAVRRLIGRYRSGEAASAPILSSRADVAAYTAYRMPATYAAVRLALDHALQCAPDLAPRSHLDVGGGTGAAAWAAAEAFPTLETVTVVDQVPDALSMGRRLAAEARSAALHAATWRTLTLTADATLPTADLVTVSYLLGELGADDQRTLVGAAAAAGSLVVVVEPGTPAGFQRILAARSGLIGAGLAIVAPCPHQDACPLAGSSDWCHFSARVARSALHRHVKEGAHGYEDEKFAYVIAAKEPVTRAPGRILRHPRRRKGVSELEVCTGDGAVARTLVSKRHGRLYRAARDATWGDPWPPPADAASDEQGRASDGELPPGAVVLDRPDS
jgi:ribosomal protein RSM22 (predicted rRNA methylase)